MYGANWSEACFVAGKRDVLRHVTQANAATAEFKALKARDPLIPARSLFWPGNCNWYVAARDFSKGAEYGCNDDKVRGEGMRGITRAVSGSVRGATPLYKESFLLTDDASRDAMCSTVRSTPASTWGEGGVPTTKCAASIP